MCAQKQAAPRESQSPAARATLASGTASGTQQTGLPVLSIKVNRMENILTVLQTIPDVPISTAKVSLSPAALLHKGVRRAVKAFRTAA